ncbi:LuxR C-terminal-related transcriptional regulator [Pseudarthrobacter sp. BRE9]|uniref:helix-turn-helix transcriptional regulator n=1 Tax=Pseudarthrobacter sp. BRE9 TaxID=2962582 RepID=UPI0028811B0C|nr:LuxR C-terminal-related transcriptional regulator [Pseudarthrobacter sp. BRE9]MDT0170324.1 LuxR C-terminal-related transcriptional regulator [Pseudarthrobacter sp. BRE9]
MPLVGRNKEIDRIFSAIRGPKETALAVVGGRGMGKSALLCGIRALSDYRTVFLSPGAAESGWPLSGLTALLNEIDDPVLNRTADELRRDKAAALTVPAVSGMLLSGLHQRSAARTIIVIDDADKLDTASQSVIGFLAKRLAGTEIVLFAGVQAQVPESPFAGLPALPLRPLSRGDTVRMLEGIQTGRTMTAAAHTVAAATGGNPLAAVELHTRLLESCADGKYALPVPLSIRSSFDADYASVIAALSPGARGVLDLLALAIRCDISTIGKIHPEAWTSADELLAAGLVKRSGQHVWIADQLLRGHVYAAMPHDVRSANHHAMAEAARDTDHHARSWHLSYTAVQRQTPFQLLRHAVDLVRGGEVPSAVEFIERALTISPREAETAERLAGLARLLFSRGELVYAQRYVEWAQGVTRNPALILRLAGLSFEIQFVQGAAVRCSMVQRLVTEFGRHDPGYSAGLLAIGALYYAERWELKEAAELLRQGGSFRGSASAQCLVIADHAKLLVESISGGRSNPMRRHGQPGSARPAGFLLRGRALTYAEQHESAREAFAMLHGSTTPDHANWRQTAAMMAVDNEIRAGNVGAAVKLIDDIEHREPEMKYHRGTRHLFRVWRAYSLGDDELAHVQAGEAQRYVRSGNHPALTAQLAACHGLFALLRGDLAESVAQLSRAAEIGMGLGNPTLLRCEADLVEVLVRLGRHREATQALQRLESRSAGLRSPWVLMVVARSRAMLADGEQSLQLFNHALEDRTGHRLERGRTLMCYAERLHAFGRLRHAREALLRAKVMFDEAGADAWTQHVDALLLDERWEPARPQGNSSMLLLADHERSLAMMVARGMRNKEIAATLYVSVRTVEVRLTAIYRKLGVESRAQLTALAAGKGTTATEPYVLPVL